MIQYLQFLEIQVNGTSWKKQGYNKREVITIAIVKQYKKFSLGHENKRISFQQFGEQDWFGLSMLLQNNLKSRV